MTSGTTLLLKQIIQKIKYNIAIPINVNNDGKNAINRMIAKVIADKRTIVKMFTSPLNSVINWLFKKLSRIVA